MLRSIHGLALVTVVAVLSGCAELKPLQDPLTGQPTNHGALDSYRRPMIENAAAHDMTLADIHFVPHTAELNGLGHYRLDLLRPALETHGGMVRYETSDMSEELVSARIEGVEQALAEMGLDGENVRVAALMSGGRGVWAVDASRAKKQMRERGASAGGASAGKSKEN